MAANRTTINSWAPLKEHVQNDVPDSGAFIDAKTVLLAAGPGRLNSLKASGAAGLTDLQVAYPIGLMESFSVNQTKTIQKIFEIGSVRSYVVPGRVLGAAQFGRTLYNGRSILNVLYAAFNSTNGAPSQGFSSTAGGNNKALSIRSLPGATASANFYCNMASDLFNHSFGLLVYMVDNNLIPYGACYLEDNYLQGHQLAINSQATVLVEGTSSQFDLCLPVTLPESDQAQSEAFLPDEALSSANANIG